MVIEPKELEQPSAEQSEDYSTRRSVGIGIACTVLFHVLLLWLSPRFSLGEFSGVHTGISVVKPNQGKSFDFQLATDVEEPKKDPFKFVETNPDAPENTPDKSDSFSSRNQQSAQAEPAKEKDPENRPSVKGQDEIKNDSSIVTGEMSKPQEGGPPAPQDTKNDSQDQEEQKARAEQVPLSGFEKREGLSEDGIATNISKSKSVTNKAEQAFEGAPNATDPEGGLVAVPQTSRAQPKARPRLTAPRSTVLTNRATGTTNMGIQATDAFQSEYGEYLQELIEIVQTQWYIVLRESSVSPAHGTHVIVKFKINSKGETEIINVEETAGKQGSFSCIHAIQARQPYRKWTEQMIALLGDSQELTFSFYYQ